MIRLAFSILVSTFATLAAGDKVKFRAEEIKGDYVVTSIEKAK